MDVNEVDYIKIGQRIRAARLKLGWQQAEVAFRAGLTTSHMSHIETGQTKVAPSLLQQQSESVCQAGQRDRLYLCGRHPGSAEQAK